jgi:AGZA family xanthine/uracil permease-like MFS transporter
MSQRESRAVCEKRGGVTAFRATAYSLLLSPLILTGSDAAGGTLGLPALITATAFAAALSTLLTGPPGEVPFAPATGLSGSGVLSSQVTQRMTWPQAVGMWVMCGVVIMLPGRHRSR